MLNDHPLDDVADAILEGAAIDWDDVAARAEGDGSLVGTLKVLAALAAVHRDTSPAERWGQFELIEPLGRGAFGRVFRARDTRLDREVALKLLDAPSSSGDERASSMVNEGRLLAQVRHRNVVTIYGAARLGEEVGLWMELIEGRTLQAILDEGKRFTVAEVVEIGGQLCSAVAAVHAAGLLHRDIKAANVMLAHDGRVVLMDFGTGWEARGTSRALPAGTPLYLAPELLDGGQPTRETDIYAIGVLLFVLLTGRYPVTASTIEALKEAHASGPRAELRVLRADVPRAYVAVIDRAMAPAPERRYATPVAMATALQQAQRRMSKPLVAAAAMVVALGGLLAAQALRFREPPSPAPRADDTVRAALRPVTSAPGEKRQPALSPDGSRVAYAWKSDDVWGIYVTEIESGRTWQVSRREERARDPAWAPDGRSLAFVDGSGTDSDLADAVRVVDIDGEGRRTVWRSAGHRLGSGLSWSPDGRHLALSARSAAHQPFRILLLDVASLNRRWLTDTDSAGGDTLPTFSPDGRSLSFIRSAGPQSALYVVNVETGNVRALPAGSHQVGDMTWSEDGRSLIFASLRAGGKDTLWRISSIGGGVEPIAGVGEGARFPSVGGGRLVYLQQVLDSNIYSADLGGGVAAGAQQIVSSTRAESAPDISPDGSRIAFTSNRNGSQEVWLATADGANARQLTMLGTTTHPRWSPDGQQIACAVGLTQSVSSGSSIHVIDAASGASRRLTDGTGMAKWPTWSADAASIYFTSNRTGPWQIWKVSAAGGDPVQVTREGGLKSWESEDGSGLYYASEAGGQTAIWRMPVEGGGPTLVFHLPTGTAWGGEWILRNEGIYWVNERVGPQIEFFSFATGRSAPAVVPKGRYDHGSGFSVSKDGRYMVFSGMDYHGTDVMMVETRKH